MSQLRIEKESFEVSIALMDSTRVTGNVFLTGLNPSTGKRQTLRDLLEETAMFLPVRQADGQVLLVNKRMIASASLPVEADPTPDFTQRVPCTLQISGPDEVQGELIMPQGPEDFRVSDHVNARERWFRVEDADRMYIVNHEAVAFFRL